MIMRDKAYTEGFGGVHDGEGDVVGERRGLKDASLHYKRGLSNLKTSIQDSRDKGKKLIEELLRRGY